MQKAIDFDFICIFKKILMELCANNQQIEAYPKTTAVLVRNHGIYVWGDSWISAKTQVFVA